MSPFDLATVILMSAGTAFFIAGTIGFIRFPDTYSRLHALTKADNLGLGLIVVGFMLQSESIYGVLKLLLVWLFVLYTSSLASWLVANAVYRDQNAKGKEKS